MDLKVAYAIFILNVNQTSYAQGETELCNNTDTHNTSFT